MDFLFPDGADIALSQRIDEKNRDESEIVLLSVPSIAIQFHQFTPHFHFHPPACLPVQPEYPPPPPPNP
jgi:hypothetical protein